MRGSRYTGHCRVACPLAPTSPRFLRGLVPSFAAIHGYIWPPFAATVTLSFAVTDKTPRSRGRAHVQPPPPSVGSSAAEPCQGVTREIQRGIFCLYRRMNTNAAHWTSHPSWAMILCLTPASDTV